MIIIKMVRQIFSKDLDVDKLLKESSDLVEKTEKTSAHIKGELKKIKKKSLEIDKRLSLLL